MELTSPRGGEVTAQRWVRGVGGQWVIEEHQNFYDDF